MGLRIRHVVVGRVRGRDLGLSFDAGDVNVFTGCNGSFKTTVLEVLTTSFLAVLPRFAGSFDALYYLSSTLRMDYHWLYWLVKDGFEAKVLFDGVNANFKSVNDPGEVSKALSGLGVTPQFQYPPLGVEARSEDGKYALLWFTYMMGPIVGNYMPMFGKVGDLELNFSFVSLSIPNPLTAEFLNAISKVTEYSGAVDLLRELIDYRFIGFKMDQFNRLLPIVEFNGRDVPIHMLGSGYLALVIMALAGTKDVVVVDNAESHLHPAFMASLADLIINSRAQWFVTTQSSEMLEALLTRSINGNKRLMLIEMSKKAKPRVFDAHEAWKRLAELNEDLRGMC